MPKEVLNEREFELINIIGSDLSSNQRDLSRQMSLSLGMTNMLIRRLISKGCIRISQLNKRKVNYLLTPKGFTEKTRKSIKYTLKTINSIGLIKEQVRAILKKLFVEGKNDFIVVGRSDFALLVEIVLKEMIPNDYKISYVDSVPSHKTKETLLVCKEINWDGNYPENMVDLIYEIAKHNSFIDINTEIKNAKS